MKVVLAAIIVACLTREAMATQYDCIFRWTTAADARADAAVISHTANDDQGVRQFIASNVVPNLQVWRNSQDTADGTGQTVHTLLPGFFVLISSDHRIPVLEADPALQVCIDRDKLDAGLRPFVVLSNVGAILSDIRYQPVWSGTNTTALFGGLQ